MPSPTPTLIERDAAVLSQAAKIRFFPFAPTAGKGVWLADADGRRLLDFSAGWAVMNTGYGHPRVTESVIDEVRRAGFPGYVSATIEATVELAERLIDIVPIHGSDTKVWFGHSGSDANEAVTRLVPRATGRRRIVTFAGSYHGSTDGSAAISGHTAQAQYAGSATSVKVPYPDAYRPLFSPEPAADERAIVDFLESYVFASISPPEDTAAVVVEAVQSDGGDLVPTPVFLQALEAMCRRHGILLILDEVKVGMGRTGKWFAYEAAGVRPDLVVLGKALGGGLPLSAVVGPRDILDVGTALALFTTAGNGPCAAAGLGVLEVIREEHLVEHAGAMGRVFQEELQAIASRQRLVGNVRGAGLINGVELVTDAESKTPAARETAKVSFRALELGLVVYYVGLRSNVLELTPPLTISEDEVRQGCRILEQAIQDVSEGRVSDEAVSAYAGW